MRIAYLCADRGIPLAGNKGASVHVRAVSHALAERGHDVNVVAVGVEGTSSHRFLPRIVEIPFDKTFKSLRKSIASGGRSIVASEIHSLLLNGACHECLLEIENQGKIDGVYERYSLWSLAGLRFARSRGLPFVLEVNAPLVQEQIEFRDLELRETATGIECILLTEADAIFVPSRELAAYVNRRVGPRRRVFVTPNGVHKGYFAGPQPLEDAHRDHRQRAFTVVFVGSLKPWHGVGALLRAFKRLRDRVPEARLLVVGHGPMYAEVERLQQQMGRGTVCLTGELPHHEIPARLRAADVGVAPYPDLDFFYFSPMKVIEYMAAGLPVVASCIGQLGDLIEHERTGLLVRPGDSLALADALERLALDPRMRSRLGQRAKRRALDSHTWDDVAGRVESVFSHLISMRVSSSSLASSPGVVTSSGGLV